MTTDIIAAVTNQSTEELADIVSQILGEDSTPAGDLSARPIGPSVGTATAGIFLVTGRAAADSGETGWSAVVKALGTPQIEAAGRGGGNEYREVEVYRSGALEEVRGGVRAALCYAIQERGDLLLLWLEDLSHAPQAPWQPEHFVATARNLGQFNAYWPEDALPEWEWLSHAGFRSKFTGGDKHIGRIERLPANAEHEIMLTTFSTTTVDDYVQYWHDCDELLKLAETTTQGVCHGDCDAKNLFPLNGAGGEGCTVGIDWVEVGIANHGVDPGDLLGSAMFWLENTPDDTEALREPVLDAYLSGLSDSGWCGDADGVRLTFLTRLACEGLRSLALATLCVENAKLREQVPGLWEHPENEIFAAHSKVVSFAMACRDEAMAVAERMH